MTEATTAPRARRCPLAIVGVWAWQGALALAVGWPASSLARAAWGAHPRGDGLLWEPGGYALLASLTREAHGVGALLDWASLVMLAGAVAGLVPTAALMLAMATARPGLRRIGMPRAVAGALRRFPALAGLLVGFTVAQAVCVGVAVVLAKIAVAVTHDGLGEAAAQLVSWAVALVPLLLAACLSPLHDLARAAVVLGHPRVGARRAALLATRTMTSMPARLVWAWAWRAGGSLALVAAGAAPAYWLGGSSVISLAAVGLIHQGVALGRVGLRAAWLARALGAVHLSP